VSRPGRLRRHRLAPAARLRNWPRRSRPARSRRCAPVAGMRPP